MDRGDKVFPNPSAAVRLWRKARRLHRSAYDSKVLQDELLTYSR